ncbi:M14 family metallopeptidase [Porticoccaceae bacterium]|nr:M14 family metallopeptidase [Porticoccaceae bacterium]
MEANHSFSHSVIDATEKFTTGCTASGGTAEKFEHPLCDPTGEPLHTTVGWLGPRNAKNVLLIVSGTHGNEGWAGSAIQIDALQRGAFNHLPENTAVMMIHLINPWGCAWGRRENEDNADLFRDLVYYKPELYSGDSLFDEALAASLTLTEYSDEVREKSIAATGRLLEKYSETEITTIVRMGQFRYPTLPYYNGGGISWSFRLYRDLVASYLSQAKQVFCIDIHTAFGEYGDALLIPYYQPEGPDKAKFDYLTQIYGAEKIYVPGDDPNIPSHPRMPYEIATDFVAGLDMISVGLEFGTYGDWDTIEESIEVDKYMSYLFNFGDPKNPERPDWLEGYKSRCYPDKDDWREMVINGSRDIIDKTVAGLSWPMNRD